MLKRNGEAPPSVPPSNPSRYWVSNAPLASGALSLLQHPPSSPFCRRLRGTTRDEPLTDRRLPQRREIPAFAGGKRGERKGDRVGRRRVIPFFRSPSFPLPSLSLGPLCHPIHPNFEGLVSFLPVQRHPSHVCSCPPPPPAPSIQEGCGQRNVQITSLTTVAPQWGKTQPGWDAANIARKLPYLFSATLESTCGRARAHTRSCSASPE